MNLAARICGLARPGELLVSDIVRGLTRTSLPVTFVDRGRRRLKGIAEPVQLYLVSRAGVGGPPWGASAWGASGSRAPRRYLVPVLAVLVLGVGGMGALVLSTTPRREPISPTASAGTSWPSLPPSETLRPLHEGSLSPGTYGTVRFQPSFSFSVGAGWSLSVDAPDNFFMGRSTTPDGNLGAFRPNVVYLGPCIDSPTQRIQGGSDGLLTWLEQHPQLESVNPRPRTVSGVTGIQIDVTAAPEQADPCPTDSYLHLIPLANPDYSIRLAPGEQWRLVVLDLPRGTVTFDMSAPGAPQEQYERFLVEAEAVLSTVDFAYAGG